MKEDLIRKFVEKLDYSYSYKTKNERQYIINDLCEIAGIEQLIIPDVSGALPPALVLYRAANTMTFEDFAKWYNGKSGNDH